MILEIADCDDRINLEFDIDSEARRANSLHKLDTLLAALRVFRAGNRRGVRASTTGGSASSRGSARLTLPRSSVESRASTRFPPLTTPWPSGEARACNARYGGSTPPGVFHRTAQ